MIRQADPADAEAMAEVSAEVAEEGLIGAEPPVDTVARARRFREIISAGARAGAWVLEENGRVTGYAAIHATGVAGVVSFGMALLPRARGRGGGRALLDEIIEHARGGGAHKVELEVWLDNARAIALYARTGFQVEGVRRAHYRRRDGSLRSTLLMAYLLDRARQPEKSDNTHPVQTTTDISADDCEH